MPPLLRLLLYFPHCTLDSHSHRTLLAFHAATIHDYIASAPSLDDGILAFILPSLLAPLKSSQKDPNVAVSCLVAGFLHSILSFRRLARELRSSMRSLPKSESETCRRICHHQRNDNSSTRGSGFRQGLSIHYSFRENCGGNLFATRGCATIPAQCMPIVHKDVVCSFFILHLKEIIEIVYFVSGFADEISKITALVGAEHFILPLLRSLGERCVDFCVISYSITSHFCIASTSIACHHCSLL